MEVTLGMKIKVLRALRNISQRQLAKDAGMRQYDITCFETDKYQPGQDVQGSIERALGCRLDADITITGDGRLVCVAPVQEVA